MALLSFPAAPVNGQLYPVAPLPGQNQYQWSAAGATWRLLGTATGVTAGTYGSASAIPILTVNAVGTITAASQVALTGYLLTNNAAAYNSYVFPNADGAANQVLTTDGSGNLSWSAKNSTSGTVTSVSTGTGLSGGPIVSTGTISLNPATAVTIGGVKPDNTTITVSATGVITAQPTGVTSITGGIGLTGGTITSTGTLALANSGVAPGTYANPSVTVDQYGRVTSASSVVGASGTFTAGGKTITVTNGIITAIV